MAGALGRASMEAHCKVTTHFSLLSSPYSLLSCPFVSIRGSFFLFRVFRVFRGSPFPMIARRFCRARRAQARQPRTALSFLLPIPYFARRAQARQPRTALSFLLPSPYFARRAQARQPRTALFSLLPIPHFRVHSWFSLSHRGAPKRASHALPSPPSSLISTTPCSSTLILMV